MVSQKNTAPQANGAANESCAHGSGHAPIVQGAREENTKATVCPARGQTPEQHATLHALADRCAAEAAAEKAKHAHYAPDVNKGREWDANRQGAMRRCEPLADSTRDPDMRDMLAISRRGWDA